MPVGTRRVRESRLRAVLAYARWGLPVCPAAYPLGGKRCSCQRLTCTDPAAHPLGHAWRREGSTDPDRIVAWLNAQERINFVSPTGLVHDVLEVPMRVGMLALTWMESAHSPPGPVADSGDDRCLFFTATRGLPVDENEWWPCDIDYRPGDSREHPGPRWHSRGSYVLVPPSVRASGRRVRWVRGPDRQLPDPLRVLDVLVDAQQVVQERERVRRSTPVRLLSRV
jgi:hypothetical protein